MVRTDRTDNTASLSAAESAVDTLHGLVLAALDALDMAQAALVESECAGAAESRRPSEQWSALLRELDAGSREAFLSGRVDEAHRREVRRFLAETLALLQTRAECCTSASSQLEEAGVDPSLLARVRAGAETAHLAVPAILNWLRPPPVRAVQHQQTLDLVADLDVAADGTLPAVSLGEDTAVEPPPTVHCFVAAPMSALKDREVEGPYKFTEFVAGCFEREGVFCHKPLIQHDPRVDHALAYDPNNRSLNERQVADSDLVVIIAMQPATGVGVIATLAVQLGVRVLVIRGKEPLTPMLLGSVPAPDVLTDGPELGDQIASYYATNRGYFQQCARMRSEHRRAATADMAKLLPLLDVPAEDLARSAPPDLSVERIRFLLSSPESFDAGSRREHRRLRAVWNAVHAEPLHRSLPDAHRPKGQAVPAGVRSMSS